MEASQLRAVLLVVPALLAGCASHMANQKGEPTAASPAAATAAAASAPPAPKVITSVPPETMYQVLVAEVAMQRGQYDVAIKHYLELARETKDKRLAERAARVAVYAHDNESAFLLIAGLLGRQQDKRAALQVMERLIEARPKDPAALLAYSHLAVRTSAQEEAEQAIKPVVELQPGRVDAIVQQARILTMRGKASEALGLLEDASKKDPKNVGLRTAYARLLVDAKQYEKAFEQFKLVNKRVPDDGDVLFALGVLAVQLDRVDEGEHYLLKLNRANKAYTAESAYYLGRIAEEFRKDPDKAIKWYVQVDRGENALESQIRIAYLTAQKGDVELAIAGLRNVAARGPAQVLRVYLVEGQLLRDAGRYQEALDVFDSGLEELPDNNDLLYSRAMVAEKLDKLDLMESDLKRVLTREPDNVDALNALGYTLADRTRRYDEATDYIQRALQLRPDSHYVLDSMGWLQYRLGNYQEAAKYLRRALEANPDSEIAAHLTEELWVMGDRQAARCVWKQALDASPGNKYLLEVMAKLDHKYGSQSRNIGSVCPAPARPAFGCWSLSPGSTAAARCARPLSLPTPSSAGRRGSQSLSNLRISRSKAASACKARAKAGTYRCAGARTTAVSICCSAPRSGKARRNWKATIAK